MAKSLAIFNAKDFFAPLAAPCTFPSARKDRSPAIRSLQPGPVRAELRKRLSLLTVLGCYELNSIYLSTPMVI